MKTAYGQPLLTDAAQVLTNGGNTLIISFDRGALAREIKYRGIRKLHGIFLMQPEAHLPRVGQGWFIY